MFPYTENTCIRRPAAAGQPEGRGRTELWRRDSPANAIRRRRRGELIPGYSTDAERSSSEHCMNTHGYIRGRGEKSWKNRKERRRIALIPSLHPSEGRGKKKPARREMKAKSAMRRAKMHDDCRNKMVCFCNLHLQDDVGEHFLLFPASEYSVTSPFAHTNSFPKATGMCIRTNSRKRVWRRFTQRGCGFWTYEGSP